MSVYNGGARLPETVDSVLSQEDVSLEFVIVNDGSTDETAQILDHFAARDARVRVIHQENQGLTKSLITGCAAANGCYIARQDAGDISLPNRLVKQLKFIEQFPNTAFVSCGTRYVGPDGEYLFEVKRDPATATKLLKSLGLETIQGPSSHPSTMFSRHLYRSVGGYRANFYFAQDLDLWIRLVEHGEHGVIPDVLYQASFVANSISGGFRDQQITSLQLILESARRRREGLNDDDVLTKARSVNRKSSDSKRNQRVKRAEALYFLGACLRKNDDPRAASYFRRALLSYPLHFKSAVRLLDLGPRVR
jgi:glycosyltransferase involved in cell wall biosynthesis